MEGLASPSFFPIFSYRPRRVDFLSSKLISCAKTNSCFHRGAFLFSKARDYNDYQIINTATELCCMVRSGTSKHNKDENGQPIEPRNPLFSTE